MASNDVNLGAGMATGMFFTAPAGTALPAYPSEELAADWKRSATSPRTASPGTTAAALKR